MNKPPYNPMPDDPLGVVEWEPQYEQVARCGEKLLSKQLRDACCKRLFTFRACRILGRIYVASVCFRCDLEYEVAVNRRLDLVPELKKIGGYATDQIAIEMAERRFGSCRNQEYTFQGQKKSKKEKGRDEPRLPYADPA
jgi:hypothetical protein